MPKLLSPRRKLHFRRKLRKQRSQVTELSLQADDHLERMVLRRLDRLMFVRRFVAGWMALFLLISIVLVVQNRNLSGYYQSLQPVQGGIYSEGIVGTFTTVNPLYIAGTADATISKLVFSGLFKYDTNNRLIGDLAQSWEIDNKETRYLVKLKQNIKWHDGQPFTADDVLFTYKMAQNPDAKSILYSSFRDIKIKKLNDYAVTFELPNQLSSFPYSLTTGILPQHLLKDVEPIQMRSATFNTSPVGTGPFEWKFVEIKGGSATDREQIITLSTNDEYHSGAPHLGGYSLRTFRNEKRLVESFKKNEITAITNLISMPQDLANIDDIRQYYTPLTSAVMVFLNNSRAQLRDVKVRQALVYATDRRDVAMGVDTIASLVDSPLLRTQPGYAATFAQPTGNIEKANSLLDEAGWKRGNGGWRQKDGKDLVIKLRSQDVLEYTTTAQILQEQWGSVGVKVEVRYYNSEDLQSNVIANHEYDALLYGISLGVDPDVFAYWHSSQAGLNSQGRLNLSEYKSQVADSALEAGRTRTDPALRAVKYRPFLEAWRNDAPAIALYQPTYLHISHDEIFQYKSRAINSGTDRLNNIHNWMIRQEKRDIGR